MKSQPFLLVVMKLLALLPLVASASNPPAAVPNASLKSSPPPAKAEPTKGDPVGVFSGNVYERAEDLRIRCPDIDLVYIAITLGYLPNDIQGEPTARTPNFNYSNE